MKTNWNRFPYFLKAICLLELIIETAKPKGVFFIKENKNNKIITTHYDKQIAENDVNNRNARAEKFGIETRYYLA